MKFRTVKTKIVPALVASLSLFPLYLQPQPATGGPAEYARAEGLVRNRAWDDGLAILVPLLAREPRNVKALNLAGLACAGKGDFTQADRYFQQSLAVDPDFLPALKNLSISEFNAQRYDLAEKHLLQAQKLLPNDPVINVFLGQIAYRQEKFKSAAERLNRVRDQVLRSPNLTATLAVSYLRSDQTRQALELLDRIAPDAIDPPMQLAMGVWLAQANLDARAIPYLQAGFHREPDSYDIGFDLALAGIHAKNYPVALAASEELTKRGRDSSELENVRAEALEASGATDQAIDAYRKAITLDPRDEDNYLDFASLCLDHRAFDDGMRVLSVGLKNRPNSERLTFMRGILNAMQDDYKQAEHDFEEAASLAPQRDFGYVGLGTAYLQRGNAEEAVKMARSRLQQTPGDASLQYLLGEGLLLSGAAPGQAAYTEAQTALEKSVQLNPGLCLPHISLGSIYLDEERFTEAISQFEQARAIDPTEKSSYSHLAVAYRQMGQPEKAKEVLSALQQVLAQGRAGIKIKGESSAEHPPAAVDSGQTAKPD